MIISVIVIYLGWGILTFWPLALIECDHSKGKWYEWLAAWIVWSICWPYRYIQDLVYWWRAKK